MTMATIKSPSTNFIVRGWSRLNIDTSVTAPSKLCSQMKPTIKAIDATIVLTSWSAILAFSPPCSPELFAESATLSFTESATLSRQRVTKNAKNDNPKARMMRAEMAITFNPMNSVAIHAYLEPHMRHHANIIAKASMTLAKILSAKLSSCSSCSSPWPWPSLCSTGAMWAPPCASAFFLSSQARIHGNTVAMPMNAKPQIQRLVAWFMEIVTFNGSSKPSAFGN
mmetsp:Transcript_17636/g.50784  ORF Transcript_17636/g.50784 Transcript_17636/m.50784 type:complete len:225 (-) Transcript_17636:1298-1972(-)